MTAILQAEFKRFCGFRRRQQFATPEIATKAYLVECDLDILCQTGGQIPSIVAAAQKTVSEFEAMLGSPLSE